MPFPSLEIKAVYSSVETMLDAFIVLAYFSSRLSIRLINHLILKTPFITEGSFLYFIISKSLYIFALLNTEIANDTNYVI